jgi:hypothetical protein
MSEEKENHESDITDPKNVLYHEIVNCSLQIHIFRNEYSFIKFCERNLNRIQCPVSRNSSARVNTKNQESAITDLKNVLYHDIVNCSLQIHIFRYEYSFIKFCERN